jgi:membrane protein implicated in regulation of membrane protease activity
MPAALIWLLLGLALLLLELLGADIDALMAAALAALVVSALAGALPLPALLQLGLFAGITMLLLLALQRRRQRPIPPSGSGEQATVISGFGPSAEGRVRWQGQSWAATNLEAPLLLRRGERVVVMGRDGNRLQVLPAPQLP